MSRSLRVLLGVSGGIAAFKAPEIVRRLRERGHEVRCAVTRSAPSFVTPLTLEVLTGHPVYREEYLEANDSGDELHISAARWADVVCVAPATCNTLARLALGLADDFLTTTVLAFAGRLVVAPAMEQVMWSQASVQGHVATLRERGAWMVGPVEGPLATGESGMGRMADPLEIAQAVESAVGTGDLDGRVVLVTAGPTREAIDPVRFLSNRSTGRMGFAMAAAAARRGAECHLIAGPVELETPHGVDRVDVVTADEMLRATLRLAPAADLIVMTAAVADFRPTAVATTKIKKGDGPPDLVLAPNADILSRLADAAPAALRVGFAAETGAPDKAAAAKLEAKNAHFIVANDVSRDDIGFASADNEVSLHRRSGGPIEIPRQSKDSLAGRLLDIFVEELEARDSHHAS